MKIRTPEQRDETAKEIRRRILNVMPAGTYAMDQFLSLVDVLVDDSTETACMEVGPRPIMHLNARFVERYCKRDEHLFMLVLHELYHVILGHTRLFPAPTPAHNIAFDAVINSMLCRRFPERLYLSFFCRLNSEKRFPDRLLRPPSGWPGGAIQVHPDASKRERKAFTLLYGGDGAGITYQEIFELLAAEIGEADPGSCTLLGDHGSALNGLDPDDVALDPLLGRIVGQTARQWPNSLPASIGRGVDVVKCLLPKPASPRNEFLLALRRLLDRAGVLSPLADTPRHWQLMPDLREAVTPLPHWRDRHATAKRILLGEAPLLFRREVPSVRARWEPQLRSHVYLDISGSMGPELPWLVSALDPLNRSGRIRTFVFSTVVDEVRRGRITGQHLKNTYGTDIKPVYDHLLAMPERRTPRKVVILTDGYTGEPTAEQWHGARQRRIDIYVGLVGTWASKEYLERFVKHVEALPRMSGA